jgi:hypothetical protein
MRASAAGMAIKLHLPRLRMRACVRTARFCPDPGQGLSNKSKLMKTIRVCLLAWLAVIGPDAVRAQDRAASPKDDMERHFESVTVGELAFTNVWVHRQTNFNILIRHNGGIHTIKLTDLPGDELAALRRQIGDLARMEQPDDASADGLLARLQAMFQDTRPQIRAIVGAAAVLLVALLFIVRRRNRTAPPA